MYDFYDYHVSAFGLPWWPKVIEAWHPCVNYFMNIYHAKLAIKLLCLANDTSIIAYFITFRYVPLQKSNVTQENSFWSLSVYLLFSMQFSLMLFFPFIFTFVMIQICNHYVIKPLWEIDIVTLLDRLGRHGTP